MLLGDLIQSVTFEQIVPHILREYPEHKSQIPYYKEAFDILRHMEYAENSATIPVEWVREEDEEPYIHIGNCEGDYWESNLGKRLEIAGDVHLSDAELAARCMWSLTFYGYSPDDDTYYERILGKPKNRYQEMAKRLKDNNLLNYARIRKSEFRKQFGDRNPAFSLEMWKIIKGRERRRNRAKRMRDARQERRIRHWEFFGNVENEIRGILARTRDMARADLEPLFEMRSVSQETYHSRAYDRAKRISWLLETLTRYGGAEETDPGEHTLLVIVLSADPAAPFDAREREEASGLIAYLTHRSPSDKVLWALGAKEGLGDEAELLILKAAA